MFFEKVNKHPSLEGSGIDVDRNLLIIKNLQNNTVCSITVDAIVDSQWSDIEDSIMGRRSPVVIHHMSRIVGYFSKMENWHDTKLAELSDRHKGDYVVQ